MNPVSQLDQELVPHMMPKDIIYCFEAVKINIQKGKLCITVMMIIKQKVRILCQLTSSPS